MTNPEAETQKIYEVTLRETGQRHFSVATNAQDACKEAGWEIGNCYVKELTPTRCPHDPTALHKYVAVHCEICPYQYAECTKKPDDECPCRPQAPDIQAWAIEASKAHLCPYTGIPLTKVDYFRHQKWLSLPEALRKFASNHLRAKDNGH